MESRAYPRYRVWLPVQLTGDTLEGNLTEGALAVSKDASEGGMFVSSTEPLAVGGTIRVSFTVLEAGEPRTRETSAEITRMERNLDDPHGPWPYRVALRFHTPIPGLAEALQEMQRELERVK